MQDEQSKMQHCCARERNVYKHQQWLDPHVTYERTARQPQQCSGSTTRRKMPKPWGSTRVLRLLQPKTAATPTTWNKCVWIEQPIGAVRFEWNEMLDLLQELDCHHYNMKRLWVAFLWTKSSLWKPYFRGFATFRMSAVNFHQNLHVQVFMRFLFRVWTSNAIFPSRVSVTGQQTFHSEAHRSGAKRFWGFTLVRSACWDRTSALFCKKDRGRPWARWYFYPQRDNRDD